MPLQQPLHQGALADTAWPRDQREGARSNRHPRLNVGQQSRNPTGGRVSTTARLQLMDLTTLRAVLSDLRPQLLPSRFEKAQQPDAASLQLGFRSLKGMLWLELSWQADAPRLVQIPPPRRLGAGSTLAQQVQHSLRQMALTDLVQSGFERVVEFHLAPRPGDPVQRVVVLELMGRHSNLLLLDQRRQVIALGRQVRDHQSRLRPISTGDAYGPPPALQGLVPSSTEGFERWRDRLRLLPIPLRKALQQTYQGISPPLAHQLAAPQLSTSVDNLDQAAWNGLYRHWQAWLHCLETERFRLDWDDEGGYRVWSSSPDAQQQQGLALALGRWYQERIDARVLSRACDELRQRLKRWRSKEDLALLDQQRRLEACSDSEALQQQADALLCLPSPSREEVDQAQKLYRRARKLRRSVAVLDERIQHHSERLKLIDGSEAFMDDLQAASWQDTMTRLDALDGLRRELDELLNPVGRRERRRQQQQHTPQPLELISPGGLLLQVGRNHRQNDWISLRQARSGDLWFHAQECPGSHVVLKSSAGLADEEDLQLARDLAAYFSRARGNVRVPVVMVPTEQLQRIAGAGPGTVRHGGGEVSWGVPQAAETRLRVLDAPSLMARKG